MPKKYGNIEALKRKFGIDNADMERVRTYGKFAQGQMDPFFERFYAWIKENIPEIYERYFINRNVQEEQKKLWLKFWSAELDEQYFSDRRSAAANFVKTALEPRNYIACMVYSLELWTKDLYQGELSTEEYQATLLSITRLLNLDISIMMDAYAEVVAEQSQALIEDIPISALWERILMLPVVGIIDSRRAENIMERMLRRITEKQAKVFILDISGVALVDTGVANHLIEMTKAAQMMGCKPVISGISPQVAQTMVSLGIETGDIKTTNTLKDALRFAFGIIKEVELIEGNPE